MSSDEYDDLRLLGSLRKESASKFIRYLLNIHIQANKSLTELMKQLKETTAKPF